MEVGRETEIESMKEMKQSKFNRICVFCGSSSGKKSTYTEAATELGQELVCTRYPNGFLDLNSNIASLFPLFSSVSSRSSFWYMSSPLTSLYPCHIVSTRDTGTGMSVGVTYVNKNFHYVLQCPYPHTSWLESLKHRLLKELLLILFTACSLPTVF